MDHQISNRWLVLAVLFAARVTMAFQFQAVAALSPIYMSVFGVGLTDIGFLIGLYLAPGLIIALPGGAIGRRFGDRQVITFGMILMLIGAVIMLVAQTWEGQVAGRVIAGIGGVLLNVLMSKVVTDYFTGREIGAAMGIFVNSWPVGIAAALLILPLLSIGGGLTIALVAVAIAAACGLLLFRLAIHPPADDVAHNEASSRLRGRRMLSLLLAGAIWGLYNGALGMVFGFGPAMLVERGWSLATASSTTSVTLWLVAVSVPLGGFLADRLQRPNTVMIVGFVTFAVFLLIAPRTEHVVLAFGLLGLSAGLSAGPVMSLPAQILVPANRAVGMGIFFTLFYVGVVFAPITAGFLADSNGTADVAFYQGVVMLVLCCGAIAMFCNLAKRLT